MRSRFAKSKPLLEIIHYRDGNHLLKNTRKFEKQDHRLRKINIDLEFLKHCLCQTFLRCELSSTKLQNSETYRCSQRLFSQEEINFKTVGREKIIVGIQKIRDDLETVLNFIDWNHISNKSL